ncbi:MAG TPA: thioredoxin family protein [bacterium]|nr:thioredoxin family protein [bacterium]
MRAAWTVGVALSLVLPAVARAGDWHEDASGYESALYEAQHTGAPVLVYFHTDWCGYCKALDAQVLSKDKVKTFLDPFVKVNINPEHDPESEEVGSKFGITGYPSVYVIAPGKKPVKVSASGEAGPDAFISAVKRVAGDPAAYAANPAPKGKGKGKDAAPPPPKVEIPAEIRRVIPADILDLQDQGKHEDAVRTLTAEIKRAGHNGVSANTALYYDRALSERALHKHTEAASDLEEYLKSHPDDAKARELLARSYLNVTMYDDAATELTRLAKDAPSGEVFFLLAESDTKRGKADDAKTHYATACKMGFKAACR